MSTQVESLIQTGSDTLVNWMSKNQIPVTLKNYLELAYPDGEKDLSAEEKMSLPKVLLDPRLEQLDSSDPYYSSLVSLLANNEELTVEELRAMVDSVA